MGVLMYLMTSPLESHGEGRENLSRPDLHLIIAVQGLLQPVALGQLLVEFCTCHATVGGASWNTGSRTCESHGHRKLCFLPNAKQGGGGGRYREDDHSSASLHKPTVQQV